MGLCGDDGATPPALSYRIVPLSGGDKKKRVGDIFFRAKTTRQCIQVCNSLVFFSYIVNINIRLGGSVNRRADTLGRLLA